MHSSDATLFAEWTEMYSGQAFVHLLQSMQVSLFLVILYGLNILMKPSNAPYGQRYLHQKLLKTNDNTSKTAITLKAVMEMFEKNISILTSATLL